MTHSHRSIMGLIALLGAATAAALALPTTAAAGSAPTREYSVTIYNLNHGQPLSPPVIATHAGRGVIFSSGRPATYGLQQISENGDSKPLQNELAWWRYYRWVSQYTAADKPLVPAGTPAAAMFGRSVTLRIMAGRGYNRLSWASMIGCSNDGFTGVDGLHLPQVAGQTTGTYTWGYDAGTERNTEAFKDIPQGCQGAIGAKSPFGTMGTNMSNGALWEGRSVGYHAGILGASNDGLTPAVHGWSGAAGYISVTALS